MGPQGYPKEFSAAVTVFRNTTPVARGVIRTNEPLFHEGYGIYIKNFGATPWGAPFAVFDANRDQGRGDPGHLAAVHRRQSPVPSPFRRPDAENRILLEAGTSPSALPPARWTGDGSTGIARLSAAGFVPRPLPVLAADGTCGGEEHRLRQLGGR
jgi:hypothetical protein